LGLVGQSGIGLLLQDWLFRACFIVVGELAFGLCLAQYPFREWAFSKMHSLASGVLHPLVVPLLHSLVFAFTTA
jgi:hypothetical protein